MSASRPTARSRNQVFRPGRRSRAGFTSLLFLYCYNGSMKFAKQFIFLFLSSAIVVFFSEKTFWYIQGYKLVPIILYYLIPTFFFLWGLQHFSANNLFSLFLAGALFGFITEGVLTTTLYEDGYLHLMSISYTSLGWHAIFSTTFGWYFLHKWLVKRDVKKIIQFSIAFGLFWGLWSLVFWMPVNIYEPLFQPPEFIPGPWAWWDYSLFTFVMASSLIFAHWLISFVWPDNYKPSKPAMVIAIIAAVFVFIGQVIFGYPFAPIKFAAVIAPTIIFLGINQKKSMHTTILQGLKGQVLLRDALWILLLPTSASLVYGFAAIINLNTDIIALISAVPGVYGLTLAGWVCWIGSMLAIARNKS